MTVHSHSHFSKSSFISCICGIRQHSPQRNVAASKFLIAHIDSSSFPRILFKSQDHFSFRKQSAYRKSVLWYLSPHANFPPLSPIVFANRFVSAHITERPRSTLFFCLLFSSSRMACFLS